MSARRRTHVRSATRTCPLAGRRQGGGSASRRSSRAVADLLLMGGPQLREKKTRAVENLPPRRAAEPRTGQVEYGSTDRRSEQRSRGEPGASSAAGIRKGTP